MSMRPVPLQAALSPAPAYAESVSDRTASVSPGSAAGKEAEAARKKAAEAATKKAAEAARKADQRARSARSRANTRKQKAEWARKFPEQPFVRKAGQRGPKEKDSDGLSKADSDKLEARRKTKKESRIKTNNAKEQWVAKPGPGFSFAKQAGGYNKSSTITMEADKPRIGFYTRALKKAASAVATGVVSHAQLGVSRPQWMEEGLAGQTRGKTVLDIGTGDNGLLAGLALKGGAAHVVAVDIRNDAAVNAHGNLYNIKPEVSGADFSVYQADIRALEAGRVKRIRRSRRDRSAVCDCDDLLSKLKTVNVIVHEVFGTIASEEGIVQIMRSLRPQLDLTQTVVFVPARAYTLICPASLPPPHRFSGGCVNSHDERFRVGYATHPEPFQLAPPQAAETLDFMQDPPPLGEGQWRELCFKAEREGQWDALHFYLQLVWGTEHMTSGGPQSNWEDVYLNLEKSVSVQPETTIRLKFTAQYKDDSNCYCVEVLEPLEGKCCIQFDSAALYALAGRRIKKKPSDRRNTAGGQKRQKVGSRGLAQLGTTLDGAAWQLSDEDSAEERGDGR